MFVGLSASDSSVLLSVMSGANAVSRVLIGIIADYIGTTFTLLVASTIASALCMIVWPLMTSYNTLMVYAVLYGVAGGGYTSMSPVIVSELAGNI